MIIRPTKQICLVVSIALCLLVTGISAEDVPAGAKAFIDGKGPGWKALGQEDFVNVNCADDTWKWEDGVIYCTGVPTGVIRSKRQYTNFEMVVEWRHRRAAGNSGVFVWTIPASLQGLKPNQLPHGIECQVLDLGYAEQYEKRTKKKPDWFTTHGDVFAVGKAKMKPFPPISPNGSRSFPSKNLTKGVDQWNHYYIRAINGEVRLWVNGEEVSGGNGCEPSTGLSVAGVGRLADRVSQLAAARIAVAGRDG